MISNISYNKIALIGDLHIGVNKNSDVFFNICEEWCNWIVKELNKQDIKVLFILGDWHHHRDEISVKTLQISSQIMKKLSDNFQVHILTGNHDCYFKDTSDVNSLSMFKEWDNVFIYDKLVTLNIQNKSVTVVPWGVEINDIPKSDYIFGHFEIKNFKMNSYTVCENGVESNSLLDKSSNIYSGHFHKYQENKYKNGSIKYVGSPYQHNYGDVGNTNGYHILDVSTGECKFYENAISPKFVYAYLSKYEGLDENNIKSNFVKLFVDKDADEKTINKAICYFEKFNPKEFVVDSIDKNPFNDVEIKNNLDSIDVFDTILEYIDTLDIDNVQKKVTIIQKIKEYYEKYNNK